MKAARWTWGRMVQRNSLHSASCPAPHVVFAGFISEASRDAEKALAPHSSTLAWKIPWTEEPGGLQSMGSGRVRHDWATSLSVFTFMLWRRKWQPTLVFLPGESQGWRSLVACRLWGRTESDTTEATQQQQEQLQNVQAGGLRAIVPAFHIGSRKCQMCMSEMGWTGGLRLQETMKRTKVSFSTKEQFSCTWDQRSPPTRPPEFTPV